MGTNTDPYQWVEGRYRLMRGHLGDAAGRRQPGLDPHQVTAAAARHGAAAGAGRARGRRRPRSRSRRIDEKAWRATEPHTPHPRKRLEAVAELNRAGIPTGVLVAPLMPGVNDDPAQVEEIVELADGGRCDAHRRHRAAPARGGARHFVRLAAGAPARPRAALRGAVPARRLRAHSGARAAGRARRRHARARPPAPPGSPARRATALPPRLRRPCSGRIGVRRGRKSKNPSKEPFLTEC